MLLVLVAILPLAGYDVFYAVRNYVVRRDAIIEDAAADARSLGRITDHALDSMVMALRILRASPALEGGDFVAFEPLARNFRAQIMPGAGLRVFDAAGTVLFASGAVPSRSDSGASARVFATGAPMISGVIRNPGTGQAMLSIDVPVSRDGKLVFDLALSLPLARLQQLAGELGLPAGRIGAIFDPSGIIAARFPDPGGLLGTRASPTFLRAQASGAVAGVLDIKTGAGGPAVLVFARAAQSDWYAAIAIPRAQILAPLLAAVWHMLMAGALALSVSMLLALMVARRLARPVSTLARLAASLEGGDVVLAHEPGVREADEVARVLEETVRRRRTAEDTADEAELRSARLIEAVPCGVIVFGRDGGWTFVNRAACALLGRSAEELLDLTVESPDLGVETVDGNLILPEERASARALRGETVHDMEVSMLRGTGGRISLLLSAVPLRDRAGQIVGALTSVQDVTERRAAQDRLDSALQTLEQRVHGEVAAREAAQQEAAHAQRMRALGQLAGGVAHDFNNVLQAISGAVSLIERRAERPEAVRRFARTASAAAMRGAAVASRLLTFARRGELRATSIEADALLREMTEILGHTLGGHVVVRAEVAGNAGWLMADRPQLQTVLVNLAANARDAMPSGGTLTLSAVAETVAESAVHPAGLAPGRYVRLDASDTGVGMDTATLARAAEPFFTTKPMDKGTGLGLAMARGFTEQLGGGFAIRSALGQGTVVHLWLPAADGPFASDSEVESSAAAAATPFDSAHVARAMLAPARLRVLLVDDEAEVRSVLAEELTERGFVVQQAADAHEARELLREARFDVLVTDFSMPGENGSALIAVAQRLRPGMPALLLTGMVIDAVLERSADPGGTGITETIGKPIRPADLAARIARLAAQAAVPAGA